MLTKTLLTVFVALQNKADAAFRACYHDSDLIPEDYQLNYNVGEACRSALKAGLLSWFDAQQSIECPKWADSYTVATATETIPYGQFVEDWNSVRVELQNACPDAYEFPVTFRDMCESGESIDHKLLSYVWDQLTIQAQRALCAGYAFDNIHEVHREHLTQEEKAQARIERRTARGLPV